MSEVQRVAYIFGNPWPVCADCHRHVYLDVDAGEWRHFPSARQQEPKDGWGGENDCP